MKLSDTIRQVRDILPQHMDAYRLKHTRGVYDECRAYCDIFGGAGILSENDCLRLQIAGLLHDISKEKTDEEQLTLCKQYGIALDRYQLLSSPVLHQSTGAYVARALCGDAIDDGIFEAISYHTTGKEGMTAFDCMLFLADETEAGRTYETCVSLRKFFYAGLDEIRGNRDALLNHLGDTMLFALNNTLCNLTRENRLIDSRTIACRNDFLLRRRAADKTGTPMFPD